MLFQVFLKDQVIFTCGTAYKCSPSAMQNCRHITVKKRRNSCRGKRKYFHQVKSLFPGLKIQLSGIILYGFIIFCLQ